MGREVGATVVRLSVAGAGRGLDDAEERAPMPQGTTTMAMRAGASEGKLVGHAVAEGRYGQAVRVQVRGGATESLGGGLRLWTEAVGAGTAAGQDTRNGCRGLGRRSVDIERGQQKNQTHTTVAGGPGTGRRAGDDASSPAAAA
jgi:hypothetical protein